MGVGAPSAPRASRCGPSRTNAPLRAFGHARLHGAAPPVSPSALVRTPRCSAWPSISFSSRQRASTTPVRRPHCIFDRTTGGMVAPDAGWRRPDRTLTSPICARGATTGATPRTFAVVHRFNESSISASGPRRGSGSASRHCADTSASSILGQRSGDSSSPRRIASRVTHPVAVISYGCWQREFGGDPRVIGHVIQIERG